jgi:hypothetical protein
VSCFAVRVLAFLGCNDIICMADERGREVCLLILLWYCDDWFGFGDKYLSSCVALHIQ